ncbi:TetR/AcrR family transcriptional regulator [Antribacter gilvus]|uniref:TetR/AcrR family transcriptional regulator n=1 Tax=Antribacter gilvus TaxID=2304675 RepID=UPI000F79F082|nr:TetR/AcrR family transcriptional regulator [Antribacter gilvus]
MSPALHDSRLRDGPRSPGRRGGAPNLGPRAAAANRAALLEAAREIFAADGVNAPLSAVSRRAGVGQGSLYRHFPDRLALVVAVFEEQVELVEAAAEEPGVELADLLGLVTRHAVLSAAFVDLVSAQAPDMRVAALGRRVGTALAGHLPAAQAAGKVRPGLTPDDLMLAVSMVAAAVTHAPEGERDAVALRAWELLSLEVRLPEGP